MKKIILGILFIAVAIGTFFFFKLVDIRTDEVKSNLDKERGLAILHEMAEAHQIQYWDSIQTYSLQLKQSYKSRVAKMMNIYPEDDITLNFDVIPNTFTSRITINSGTWKDKVFGIQSWRTFAGSTSSSLQFDEKNNADIEFGLPTYQYFIEAPKRILEADIISYAGERTLKGKSYDLVYATWKSPKPQRDIDQYILWIDKETKLLRYMHYTVRDKMAFAQGTRSYDSYVKKDNVLFPERMTSILNGPENESIAQTIEVLNIQTDKVSKESLMLDPKMGTTGKQ